MIIIHRLWENSKHVAKQLDKIGLHLSTTLVNAGLTDFQKILNTGPREIELVRYYYSILLWILLLLLLLLLLR